MPVEIVEVTTVGNINYITYLTADKEETLAGSNKNLKAISKKALKEYRESLETVCSFCHKSQMDKLVCSRVSTYCA